MPFVRLEDQQNTAQFFFDEIQQVPAFAKIVRVDEIKYNASLLASFAHTSLDSEEKGVIKPLASFAQIHDERVRLTQRATPPSSTELEAAASRILFATGFGPNNAYVRYYLGYGQQYYREAANTPSAKRAELMGRMSRHFLLWYRAYRQLRHRFDQNTQMNNWLKIEPTSQ